MNCLWQDIPDTTDERGWRKTICLRCRHETAPWPAEQRHYRYCTGNPFAHEWGHWLEIALAVIWLDKRRWLWLKAQFGLQPKCGCQERQAALNTYGEKLRGILNRLWYNLTARKKE